MYAFTTEPFDQEEVPSCSGNDLPGIRTEQRSRTNNGIRAESHTFVGFIANSDVHRQLPMRFDKDVSSGSVTHHRGQAFLATIPVLPPSLL